MVVPAPPGGGADVISRALAEGMRHSLGQPIIVENVAGANGSIAGSKLARAAPDGRTIGLGTWNSHVSNGALYALPYDVVKDFEPVSLLTEAGRLIVAGKAVQANDLRGLVSWLKTKPEQPLLGTSGQGSMEHVSGHLLSHAIGAPLRFVHYRGVAPAFTELIGGHFDMMITGITEALPHVRSGSLKAYAVTAPSRFASLPAIPTVDEAGLPGMYAAMWTGLWSAKGTPREIISALNNAVIDALSNQSVRSRFPEPAIIVARDKQTPEALHTIQRADIAKWWPIIRALGLKID